MQVTGFKLYTLDPRIGMFDSGRAIDCVAPNKYPTFAPSATNATTGHKVVSCIAEVQGLDTLLPYHFQVISLHSLTCLSVHHDRSRLWQQDVPPQWQAIPVAKF